MLILFYYYFIMPNIYSDMAPLSSRDKSRIVALVIVTILLVIAYVAGLNSKLLMVLGVVLLIGHQSFVDVLANKRIEDLLRSTGTQYDSARQSARMS